MTGWIGLGIKIIPWVLEAISWVEKFIATKGKHKQDAAVYMIKSFVGVAETATARELLDDKEIDSTVRKVIDLVVHLENLIATKRAG